MDDPAFHFAKISQSYQALYLLVNTTRSELTVTAYDLNGSVVDTFTVEHDNACRDGHSFVFDRLHKTLICSVCGETAPANYTGWATDKTSGKQMYFLAGEYKTGWMLIGTAAYHFDLKNGTMHKTTILEDVPTTCSVQGHLSVKCECGETYETKYDKPSGHSFSKVVADDGTVYYHCDRCGKISTMDMPFVDVDDTDWFAEAVYYCYQNSLLRGRSEMSFDPGCRHDARRARYRPVAHRRFPEFRQRRQDAVHRRSGRLVVHRSRELVLGEQDRQRHRRRPVRPRRPDHA